MADDLYAKSHAAARNTLSLLAMTAATVAVSKGMHVAQMRAALDEAAQLALDALTESIGATVEAGLIARLRLKLESIKVDGPTKAAIQQLLED